MSKASDKLERLMQHIRPEVVMEVPPDKVINNPYLSEREKTVLRCLVTDRIENRFAFAAKAANDLNSTRLETSAAEIKELEALREKLK